MVKTTMYLLTCQLEECQRRFPRAATGVPARFCSREHRNRQAYLDRSQHRQRRVKATPEVEAARRERRKQYMRDYWSQPENKARRQAYAFDYNRRPEVMERQRQRMFRMWHEDPEYRERALARMRAPDVTIAAPYTGHPWLDRAAEVVGGQPDPTSPWSEYRYDEMGEALLAFLEGRDPKEAVVSYRKREYPNRYLTLSISDFKSDPDEQEAWFDRVMPNHESAEDEAMARESVIERTPYHHGRNGRPMRNKQQQPSRRRMKDAGWRKYEHQGR